jgi:hypothetical protein
VATKNVVPYAPSLSENLVSIYSLACRKVKYSPNNTVKVSPINPSFASPDISAWCAHVTVTPDDRSTTVFSSGTPQGLSGLIPIGGHILPSSTVGANLLWKNAQKNPKKKHTSDRMNSTIPIRRPRDTIMV